MATTTTDDGGFHEIQLNGKQLVFLFMAVTVVSVVIFLCGVLVGRSVRTESVPTEVTTRQQGAPPVAEPPPSAVTPGTNPSAAAKEDVSYPDVLVRQEPPSEPRLQEKPPAPPPAPSRVEPVTPAVARAPAEPSGPGYAIQLAALGKRAEADGIARRLTGKGYPAYVIAPEAGAPAVFRVRVGKFKERREAESIKARLEKEEQFNPWIVR